MNLLEQFEAEQLARLTAARTTPDFAPGDTVRVMVKVQEGERVAPVCAMALSLPLFT